MKIALRLVGRHRRKVAAGIHQVLRHKDNQNSPHAIIAKTFRELITYNKRYTVGYFGGRIWGSSIWNFHKCLIALTATIANQGCSWLGLPVGR